MPSYKSASLEEKQRSDDGCTAEEGEELPVAIAWNGELFDNDLRAGDVDERAGGNAIEYDLVDVICTCKCNAEDHTEWSCKGEDCDELATKSEVVREGLDERDAQRTGCGTFVDADGDEHVDHIRLFFAQTKGQAFKDRVNREGDHENEWRHVRTAARLLSHFSL